MEDFGELGSAKFSLRVDFQALDRDLKKAGDRVDSAAKKIGDGLKGFGTAWSAAITAPIVAGTAIALLELNKIDEAFDRIRAGTGATGQALQDLKRDFADTLGQSRQSVEAVSQAIADLNTRTGQRGPALQELATQFLNLSEVTGENGIALIGPVTRVFGDWSIATDRQSEALDTLFRASQQTGATIAMLADQTVKYGAPLRQLGFGLEETIALFGKWEKEGVNTEIVMSGVRAAMSRMAQAGIRDVPAAFRAMIETIQAAGTAGEANALALQFFGAKAGPDMAAAIREGRFEIAGLVADLQASTDTINGVADENEGLWESFTRNANKVRAALAETQDDFDAFGSDLKPVVDEIGDGLAGLIAGFNALPNGAKATIVVIAAIAAALGPLLVGIGALVTGWPLVVAAFTAGAGAIGAVAPIVATVTLALVALGATVNAFRVGWQEFGGDFKRIAGDFAAYWDTAVDWIAEGWDLIREDLGVSREEWRAAMNSLSADAQGFAAQALDAFEQVRVGLFTLRGSMESLGREAAGWVPDWLQDFFNSKGMSAGGPMFKAPSVFQLSGGLKQWLIEMGQGLDILKESLAGDPDFIKGGILATASKQAKELEADLRKLAESGTLDAVARGLEGGAAPQGGGNPLAGFGGGASKSSSKKLSEWDDLDQKLMEMERGLEIATALDSMLLQAEQKALSLRQSVIPEEGAIAELQALQQTIAEFPEFFDEETISLLSGDVFQRFGEQGEFNIQKVIDLAESLNPVFKEAGEGIRDALEKSKAIDRLSETGSILEKIGGVASDLPGLFRKFGQVVQSVGKIVQASARLMAGDFTALIDIFAELISMMGIFGEQSQEEAKGIGKIMDDIGEAAEQWGEQLTDILVDFVRTGTLSFEDLANQIINDLLRITIQAAIVDPLIDFGGDLLGFANGGVFAGGQVYKAANGIVTRPTDFAFPGGLGIMGEGGGPGEAVIPLAMVGGQLGVNAAGMSGGGDMVVEIVNTGPAPVNTSQTVDPDGVRRLKAFVHNVVNEGLAGGAHDAALGAFFNVSRRGARG